MRLSGAPGGSQPREGRFLERTAPWAVERMRRKGSSGCLVEELDLVRWTVGQRLGLLVGEF